MDVGNLISGSSAFSKSSQHIWKFSVHILLKTGLGNFDHFQFTLIHRPNIPGSYAVLFFTASDFTFTTRHVHTWALFLLWLSLFIPSEVFLCSFPVAYWAPTNLGSPSFSVISFCLFILFVGFSRQGQRRQWHPTPVLLPGKSHGWRSLIGCSPWGRTESDTTERLHFHFSLSCIGEGNGNPLQCSCLENPRDRRAWWAVIYGVAQSWTWLKWLSSSSSKARMLKWFVIPFSGDHILSELSTKTCPSWMALHDMTHSFIEWDKVVTHVISLANFLWWWFSFCLPSEG